MPLSGFDHVSIQTGRLEQLVSFYCEVVGLRQGRRPGFSFSGAWLYAGEKAVVHLVETSRRLDEPSPRLRIAHFAFNATGLADFLDRFEQRNIKPRLGFVRDFGICQVNINDPDGNHLHIDFPLAEAEELGLDQR